MDQMGEGLKKAVQAGMGAVAAGVEKTQGAIDKFAKKGEPIYEQAKEAVCETTDKIKKAVQRSPVGDMLCCRPKVESILKDLKELTPQERDYIRKALDNPPPQQEKTASQPNECRCQEKGGHCPEE